MQILLKSPTIINEGRRFVADVLIKNGRIERVDQEINTPADREINAEGLLLLPGLIDDQVHFREPGLTHKATIYTESRAAVAGGITSFMEMPNTVPNTLTQGLLQDKYDIAAKHSAANYSFYMGASNDNIDEVLKTNASEVCGVKVFMGSSTGNMLVDNEQTLESIFSRSPMLNGNPSTRPASFSACLVSSARATPSGTTLNSTTSGDSSACRKTLSELFASSGMV